jgi:glucose/arabinose dehydrogenase
MITFMRVASLSVLLMMSSCGSRADEQSALGSSGTSLTNASVTSGESISLVAITNIDQPVDAAMRFDDPALYIASRLGVVYRVASGESALPVFDITNRTTGSGERGLLGLAFAPDGSKAYLNYTDLAGDTKIVQVDVSSDGIFVQSSLTVLLSISQPYANHNAGDIVVESSGTLLVATGDGGSAGDPLRVALSSDSLLGKVLRIDPITFRVSILAKGLRNPWRVDLYKDQLWLADVGQNKYEEINVLENVEKITGPQDFGWSAYEGYSLYNKDQSSPGHLPPRLSYEHGEDGCSISGGAVASEGSLLNRYVFADYCSGRVWSVATDEPNPVKVMHFDKVDNPVAVVRAGNKLLVLSLSGTVWQIKG